MPFAFAIGALATGRVGEGWLVETRRWTLFAWGFLTVGIVLGAWWSYEVLGWGGYWAWDPVENASFLPWLTGTAYLHSVMVQERRGMLRVWNLSLLCATFALTILGTFLTRSGVLDSVHAFTESGIGPAFLVLLRADRRGQRRCSSAGGATGCGRPGASTRPSSREGAFLANNLLFAAFAFVVLLGTVFPLLVEAVNGDRISVGVPYFDRMTMPIGLALLFLMAVAPVLPWRKASGELLRHRLYWPAWVGDAAPWWSRVLLGARGLAPLLAFGLGGLRRRLGRCASSCWPPGARAGAAWSAGPTAAWSCTSAWSSSPWPSPRPRATPTSGEFRLAEGQSAEVGGHTVTYLGLETIERSEKTEIRARVQIDDDGVFTPSLSEFRFGGQAIGTPSVRVSARRRRLPRPAGPARGRHRRGPAPGRGAAPDPVALDRRWRHGAGHGAGRPGRVSGAGRPTRPRPVLAVRRRRGRPSPRRIPSPSGSEHGRHRSRRPPAPHAGARSSASPCSWPSSPWPSSPSWPPATRRRTGSTDSPLVGELAPPLAGEIDRPGRLGGTAFDLDRLRGQWVVVNFFATWCVPCVVEHPELVEFSERHADVG